MDNISSIPNLNNNAHVGTTATRVDTQQTEINVQRVAEVKESFEPQVEARSPEEARFEAIRAAARYYKGANPFLADIKYTIYKNNQANEYEIRFTDVGTGDIEVKTERQLLAVPSVRDTGTLVDGTV